MPPRKRLRLSHHDYATPGAYFVTVCTQDRVCLFGAIADGEVRLSAAGKVVSEVWQDLPAHYPNVSLDEFVVMPNHLHGVVVIEKEHGRSLSTFMQSFKSYSTRGIRTQQLAIGAVWQRGYYEHVVRDESDLTVIREYIRNNPAKWDLDDENPERRR